MTTDLAANRRFFAEEVQIAGNIETPALVEALASVPRERFLSPGPWVIASERDFRGPLRKTPGDDPRFVYHNISIAIDPARMLFNGSPSFVASAIDALRLRPGHRVLHVGTGTGYYTALMAHAVGPTGLVCGIEVDADLAALASANLADRPWVDVRIGDGRDPVDGPFDAIFVNAGVTHPERAWLDTLRPGGRLMLPLTATLAGPAGSASPFGAAMATISKGLMVLVTREASDGFAARVWSFVGIYSALGLRDEDANRAVGQALAAAPFPQLRRLRLDDHDASDTCWCHTARACWSLAEQDP
jgi:protein-L-isoaspartate(D-aspartate) O-methyltransferase